MRKEVQKALKETFSFPNNDEMAVKMSINGSNYTRKDAKNNKKITDFHVPSQLVSLRIES